MRCANARSPAELFAGRKKVSVPISFGPHGAARGCLEATRSPAYLLVATHCPTKAYFALRGLKRQLHSIAASDMALQRYRISVSKTRRPTSIEIWVNSKWAASVPAAAECALAFSPMS